MNSHANLSPSFLQSPQSSSCKTSGWKAQFACPSGKLGWLAGQIMAVKNAGMNRFAVEMLDVQVEDQVLEIGFGHGRAIELIARQAQKGFVAGIDLSAVMVRQAAVRNREFIKSGHVELSLGNVANIPYEYARFDKVLAVNNYQFWPNAEHNLVEIQRVLREEGKLILCLRMKEPNKAFQLAPGFTQDEVDEIAGLVRWVGFRNVQVVKRKLGREASCVIGQR